MTLTVEHQVFLKELATAKPSEMKKNILLCSREELMAIIETLINLETVLPEGWSRLQRPKLRLLLNFFKKPRKLFKKRTVHHLLKYHKDLAVVLSAILTALIDQALAGFMAS